MMCIGPILPGMRSVFGPHSRQNRFQQHRNELQALTSGVRPAQPAFLAMSERQIPESAVIKFRDRLLQDNKNDFISIR